jgi:hypothetical protein
VTSLAANVAVAESTVTGQVITAWPSLALIGSYELLMRQVRRDAAGRGKPHQRKPVLQIPGSRWAARRCRACGTALPDQIPGMASTSVGGRLVKRAGAAGEFATEPSLRLIDQRLLSALSE